MPLEKSPMGDNCAAERIVVEHEPDLHSGQRDHEGCQRGPRDGFGLRRRSSSSRDRR